MKRTRGRYRRERTVAVTGAAAGLGRALLERLAARPDAGGLIAIDVAAGRTEGVTWRAADPRDPLLVERLAGASTVVHLATSYDARADVVERHALNVRGTEAVLVAARAAGADRVVLVTAADVLAPGPLPLPDDAPLRAAGGGLLGEHLEMERLAAAAGLAVAVLRPATLVGGPLGASYDGMMLRQLAAPRLLAARGVEPLWQLCHADDLLSALEVVVLEDLTGAFGVACDGWLPQSVVEQVSGRSRLELPAGVALSTAERLHRLGVTTASPSELDHLVAPIVVAADRLRAAGWAPAWSNEDALRRHLAESPADGRAGAYTAAGATVALLGTAALVRQARRRRRR